jgi:hypothetical protein
MSSNESQPIIKLIKCLYNTSTSSNPLCISDKCFNAYAEMYDKELDYDGKRFSIDKKLITLVEELGFDKCSGFSTYLSCQLMPEELKEYIVVGFVEGTKKVYIDYDKAYVNILHKQIIDCDSGEISDELLVKSVYKQYQRITYIKERFDELMTQTLDKAYNSEVFSVLY